MNNKKCCNDYDPAKSGFRQPFFYFKSVREETPYKLLTTNMRKNQNRSYTSYCITDNSSDRHAGGNTTDGMRLEHNMGKCFTFRASPV